MSADLEALVALMPFAGQLGLVLDEASPDRVVARLDWAPRLCTAATITSATQLFRPVSSGSVRAAAVPLYRGRATVTAQTTQVQAVRSPA
jgi:1,4-dihydroxy-2-naphthoyl-CoA hydrolase